MCPINSTRRNEPSLLHFRRLSFPSRFHRRVSRCPWSCRAESARRCSRDQCGWPSRVVQVAPARTRTASISARAATHFCHFSRHCLRVNRSIRRLIPPAAAAANRSMQPSNWPACRRRRPLVVLAPGQNLSFPAPRTLGLSWWDIVSSLWIMQKCSSTGCWGWVLINSRI